MYTFFAPLRYAASRIALRSTLVMLLGQQIKMIGRLNMPLSSSFLKK